MFNIQKIFVVAVSVAILAGCAATSITPISKNQVLISTNAAPACGTDGAAKVASQMAAVATLRSGYQRYVLQAAGVQNNTRVVSTGPTYATTYGSTTYFGGSTSYLSGSNNAEFAVLMLNPGDHGYSNGLDAKSILGSEWEKKVRDGINTCG